MIKRNQKNYHVCVFPDLDLIEKDPLLKRFCLHRIGYFENMHDHGINRPKGAGESILIYCVKGQGEYRIENKSSTVIPGDVFFVPVNKAHSYFANKQDPWSIYWAHITGSDHLDLMVLFGFEKSTSLVNIGISNSLIHSFKKAIDVLSGIDCIQNIRFSSSIMQQSLIELERSEKLQNMTDKFQFKNLIVAFDNSLQKNLTLDEMSDIVGLTKFHFIRKFKKAFGMTPLSYFLNVKIKHAIQKLEYSELSVKEISHELGFDDPYYFSRLFKKITGLSPKNYRVKYIETLK